MCCLCCCFLIVCCVISFCFGKWSLVVLLNGRFMFVFIFVKYMVFWLMIGRFVWMICCLGCLCLFVLLIVFW